MSSSENEKPRQSVTSITLGWLADKLRRAEKIKQEIKSGSYKIDSTKIAESITNKE